MIITDYCAYELQNSVTIMIAYLTTVGFAGLKWLATQLMPPFIVLNSGNKNRYNNSYLLVFCLCHVANSIIINSVMYIEDALPVASNTRTAMAVAFLATPYCCPIMVPIHDYVNM